LLLDSQRTGGHGGPDADEDEEEGEDELAEDAAEEIRLRRLAAVAQRKLRHGYIYINLLQTDDRDGYIDRSPPRHTARPDDGIADN